MRAIRPIAVVVTLVVLAGACGSSGTGQGTTTTPATSAPTTSTTTAATTSTTSAPEQSSTTAVPTTTVAPTTIAPTTTVAATAVVGKVTKATGGSVGAPPRRPQADDPLHAGDPVATGQTELVEFALTRKITGCKLFGNSDVTVGPAKDVLLAVRSGTVLCRTDTTPGKETLQIAGRPVTVADPVFLVEAGDGSNVTVHVLQGAVAVQDGRGWHAYNAGQAVAWSGTSDVGGFGWGDVSQLPPEVQDDAVAYTSAVATELGPIAYPPFTSGSSLAGRFATTKVMNVGVDVGADPGHGLDIARALLTPMVGAWGGEARINRVPTLTGTPLPGKTGGPDLLVTPRPPRGTTWLPLFSLDGAPWYVIVPPGDTKLAAAVASFLRTMLTGTCPNPAKVVDLAAPGQSCYEQRYREAIGVSSDSVEFVVPLDALLPVLRLG